MRASCPPFAAGYGSRPVAGPARAQRPKLRHIAARANTQKVESDVGQILRLEMDTRAAQMCLKFEAVKSKKGQAIAVTAVEQDSEAWRQGIRPGHRLVAISDPVRADDIWEMSPMASGRFVRDTLKLRAFPTIRMHIDTSFSTESGFMEESKGAAAVSSEGSSSDGPSNERGGAASSSAPSSYLDAVTSSLSESGSDSEDGSPTVAQRLEERYRKQQNMAKQQTAVQKRIAKRKEYLSQVGDRNDAPFFTLVAAAFLLPPIAILAWAFFSGYLDQLARGYGP